jgi:K+-sensing histidine kinase KdpD
MDMEHSVRTRLAILTLLSGNLDLLYERLNEDKRRQMIRDIRTHTQALSELVCDVIETSGGLG